MVVNARSVKLFGVVVYRNSKLNKPKKILLGGFIVWQKRQDNFFRRYVSTTCSFFYWNMLPTYMAEKTTQFLYFSQRERFVDWQNRQDNFYRTFSKGKICPLTEKIRAIFILFSRERFAADRKDKATAILLSRERFVGLQKDKTVCILFPRKICRLTGKTSQFQNFDQYLF